MLHELKITIGENLHSIKVYVDDRMIGLIQELKFSAGINPNSYMPDIEVVFPNLFGTESNLVKDLEQNIEDLKHFPYVKVILKDL